MNHKRIASIGYYLFMLRSFLSFTTGLPAASAQENLIHSHPLGPGVIVSTTSYLPIILRPPLTWTFDIVDSGHPMSFMGDHSLRLTADDQPRMAFGSNHLFYAHLEENGWSVELVDGSSGVGKYTSLALGSGGSPYISYYDATNKDLKYAHWNGSSWDIQVIDAGNYSTYKAGTYTAIALDSNNYPAISYLGNDYNYTQSKYVDDLKYVHWNGSSWSSPIILDSSDNITGCVSMGMDPDNHPHISYYDDDTNKNLKYIQYNGSAWFQVTFDPADNTGKYSSLAVDKDSNTFISYLDESTNHLKLVTFNNIDLIAKIETVDPTGKTGMYSSIALDSHGFPHIAYYDFGNKDLKYARWTGTEWVITTLDSSGDVGKYASLALDSHDLAHISYFDATHNLLKYAVQN